MSTEPDPITYLKTDAGFKLFAAMEPRCPACGDLMLIVPAGQEFCTFVYGDSFLCCKLKGSCRALFAFDMTAELVDSMLPNWRDRMIEEMKKEAVE